MLCDCNDVLYIQMWLSMVQIFKVSAPSLPPSSSLQLCFPLPLRSRLSAACLQPPKFVRMGVMYSAALPRFHLRAANFLSPGYSNCSISILHQAATGSTPSHFFVPIFILHFEQTSQNKFDNVCYLLFRGSKNLIILTAASLHTFFFILKDFMPDTASQS